MFHTISPEAVVTIALAGGGALGTVTVWALRAYVRGALEPVKLQLSNHVVEDRLIHAYVTASLDKLDAKTDKMDEKLDRLVKRGN